MNTYRMIAWLDWQPRISLPLWMALLLVFASCWIAYAVRSRQFLAAKRRSGILFLMFGAGLVPLVLLLNPTWIEALPPPDGLPRLTILVDTSESMDVADDEGLPNETRLDRATDLTNALIGEFEKTYETRVFSFDAESNLVTPDAIGTKPLGRRTDLASAIQSAADSDRPRGQAIVLLSDGIHNTGASSRAVAAARGARGRGAPIFPITISKPWKVNNVSIETTSASRLAFVDQPVSLSAKVVSRGFDPAPIEVDFVHDDQVIESKSVVVDHDSAVDVSFTTAIAAAGLQRYWIRVRPLPGEATEEDNSVGLLVRVIDSPIGVLLLEGKPYWDSKFLSRNLAADPSIRLESLVMLRSDRFLRRRQSASDENQNNSEDAADQSSWQILPSADEVLGSSGSLEKYQVIVLGRDAEAYLDETTLSRLRTWVSTQGGSLVCSRGAPQSTLSQKLGRMLPVRWTPSVERRFRVSVSDASVGEGWLMGDRDDGSDPLAAMPSLVTSSQPETRGGLPMVLAVGDSDGDSIPIVTYQPFGAGRTVVVEGGGMWRWALLPPQYASVDATYAGVWNGLLQWLVSRVALAPGQLRTLQSDRVRFSSEQIATATLLVRDSVSTQTMPAVVLSGETDGSTSTVVCEPVGDSPGVFQARFGKLSPGGYRAELVDSDPGDRSVTAFEVRQPIEERLELDPNTKLLQAIASDSGGQVLAATDATSIAKSIDAQVTASLPVDTRQTPAWDRWWVLLAIVGFWTTVWIIRRRSGLV